MDVAALPYCGGPPLPADLLMRWNFDPLLVAGLLALWLLGVRTGARLLPLATGTGLLAVLFLSPICALSSALFSMRVTHHVVLTALAAPLFAIALPRVSGHIWSLAALHTAIFWLWHIPGIYALALRSHAIYWLMQASLFGSALLLWRTVRSAPAPLAVSALLEGMVQMGLLGALLTFSGVPLYAWHSTTTQPWGMTPLEDQQLGGLMMWVPGAAIYLAAALWRANGWFAERGRLAAA